MTHQVQAMPLAHRQARPIRKLQTARVRTLTSTKMTSNQLMIMPNNPRLPSKMLLARDIMLAQLSAQSL